MAVLFGLVAVPMIGMAGLAVDTLMLFATESRLQRALDSAGLAVARLTDETAIAAEANAFFAANLGPFGELAEIQPISVTFEPEAESYTLSAEVFVPAFFMQSIGVGGSDLTL